MKKILPFLLFAACSIATAQEERIRICTYNVLNYSTTNEDGRAEKFERIIDAIKPDIVIVQEIGDFQSYYKLASAIRSDEIRLTAIGGFRNGPDTDNGIYFNIQKLSVVRSAYHATALRDIAHFTVQVLATNDTLHIFSVHLKAGDTDADAGDRMLEVQTLKENMPMGPNDNVLVVGDFNFYSPEEVGYTMLTNTGFQMLTDPLGEWVRNSTQYLSYYTQSPRMVVDGACGGGTGGGMDDRFDFIFHSDALGDNVVNGSYTVFGNDGADRRNAPINTPPNKIVSASIAEDLFCASDHLPVYEDFFFSGVTSVEENMTQEIVFKETSNTISLSLPATGTVTIIDILGRVVVKESVTERWSFQKEKLQSGVYYAEVLQG